MTKALVDYQTTQLASIMLSQRMAELQSHMRTTTRQLQMLKRRMASQRQKVSQVASFRAKEHARDKIRTTRNGARQESFRMGVQDAFQVTQKNKNWRQKMTKLAAARRRTK